VVGPTLQLPNFDATFIVNYDVSGSGFGVVLHQDSGPIAFYIRPIAPQHAKLVVYERELIWAGQSGAPLAAIPLDPPLCGADRPLRAEVFVGSAHLHHPLTCLGEKVIWL
jgi:hypothetical protein